MKENARAFAELADRLTRGGPKLREGADLHLPPPLPPEAAEGRDWTGWMLCDGGFGVPHWLPPGARQGGSECSVAGCGVRPPDCRAPVEFGSWECEWCGWTSGHASPDPSLEDCPDCKEDAVWRRIDERFHPMTTGAPARAIVAADREADRKARQGSLL